MRRVLTAGVLAALLVGPLATQAAVPTVTVEGQAWWRKAGIVVPTAVGSHIHLRATVPADGVVVDGVIDVPVTVTLHDAAGVLSNLLYQDEGGTPRQFDLRPYPPLGPCADCSATYIVPIDLSRFATGRRELRIRAEIDDEDPALAGDQRFFISWNAQVCVRSCSESGITRPANFTEARGWYTAHDYQNARLTSPVGDVRPGAAVDVKLAPGAGGEPTVLAAAYLDPDMHGGSAGRVLLERSGPYTGAVTIPSDLGSGAHRLVLLASDGKNAGVLVVPFTVGGPAPTPTPEPTPSASGCP